MQLHRLISVCSLAYHPHVGLRVNERRNSRAQQRVVIDRKNADEASVVRHSKHRPAKLDINATPACADLHVPSRPQDSTIGVLYLQAQLVPVV
jgi:hypothetical protein